MGTLIRVKVRPGRIALSTRDQINTTNAFEEPVSAPITAKVAPSVMFLEVIRHHLRQRDDLEALNYFMVVLEAPRWTMSFIIIRVEFRMWLQRLMLHLRP